MKAWLYSDLGGLRSHDGREPFVLFLVSIRDVGNPPPRLFNWLDEQARREDQEFLRSLTLNPPGASARYDPPKDYVRRFLHYCNVETSNGLVALYKEV